MIPEDRIAEVRARADIVEVIGRHVPLKRAGKEYRALCPFHQEKSPSFYVVPSKGIYKCFGCGEAGDVFTFLMKRQGLDFQEAVRTLADQVGVEIRTTRRDRATEEANQPLYEAVAFAAEFFQRQLRDADAGRRAREYLQRRGIDERVAERFGLGYSPDEWRALRGAAARHGIGDGVLLAAGLVKESERSGEPYDRFRGRLMFPIQDGAGRVIGFGGRVLDSNRSPKYLNSPETALFQKGRVLYGLSWARTAIRREQDVLVVEGYMDYVSLAAAGIEHVVAPLGTAMTDEQAQLLARYTKRAVLLYDSDAAGLRATFRSADALLRAGVHPRVATLPPGEDPDSLVRRRGTAGLAEVLDSAVDVLDRKIEILEARGYLRDIDGVRTALNRLLPTLQAVTDPALRDIYVHRVAERTGVKPATLEAEIRGGSSRWKAAPAVARPERSGESTRRGDPTERKLILLLLRDPARVSAAAQALRAEDLTDPVYRELFVTMTGRAGETASTGEGSPSPVEGSATQERRAGIGWLDAGTVARLSSQAMSELEALERDPEELSNGDRILADLVGELRARALFRRLDELDALMATAKADEQDRLLRARAEIRRELEGIMAESARLGFKFSRRYRRRWGGVGAEANVPSPEQG